MVKSCNSCCDTHGKKVQELVHNKVGTLHILSSIGTMEGLMPGMFQAEADYETGDSLLVNSQEYTPMFLGGSFKKGELVSVLVDTQDKRLGLASGNAQAVREALERHMADTMVHIAEEERQTWNNKADRASGGAVGNLAALDAVGNPVDSGKATEDFATTGNIQALREEMAEKLAEIRASLSEKASRAVPVAHVLPLAETMQNSSLNTYCKTEDGHVWIYLFASKTSGNFVSNELIAVLPDGFRPKERLSMPVTCWKPDIGYGISILRIEPTGDLRIDSTASSYNRIVSTVSFY